MKNIKIYSLFCLSWLPFKRFSKNSFLLPFIIYFMSNLPFYTFAKEIIFQMALPPKFFNFKGLTLPTSSVMMSLKENEIDLSFVIKNLERVKEAHYENISSLDSNYKQIQFNIELLCKNSKNIELCINNASTELQEAVNKIKEELSQKILYPEQHKLIGESESVNNSFEDLMNGLSSACINACAATNVIVAKGSQEQYFQLYDKAKNIDQRCLREMLGHIRKELESHRFPKKCMEKENKNHPVCKYMFTEIDVIRGRVLEIAELAYGSDFLNTTEAKSLCLDCVNKFDSDSGNKFLNIFSNLVGGIGIEDQCYELKPGQEKKVYSGTGLNSNKSYKLIRELDGGYSIPLDLRFVADEDYDGEVEPDKVPEHYMNKVRECVAEANDKILGPNGEQLKVVIHESKEECKDKAAKEIKIGAADHRSNSEKYDSDIDCPTITHEVLHLLNLCDEYVEKKKGFYVDSETGEVMTEILDRMEDNKELMEDERYAFKLAYNCRAITGDSMMFNEDNKWVNVFREGTDESLVTPGQFNAILYGTCEEKNKLFNECSQLAYKNSIDTSEMDCIEKKRQCEEQNFLGVDKQKEMKKIQDLITKLNKDRDYYLEELQDMEEKGEQYKTLSVWRTGLKNIEKRLSDFAERLEIVKAWP